MKKIVKTYWQLLIMPVLFLPYQYLNSKVIVEWLGCGCPLVDEQGNEIVNNFNANDFTMLFWSVVALIVIIISIFNMRYLIKWYAKLTYILLIAVGSVYLVMRFCDLMRWK